MQIHTNVSLKDYSTMRLGGTADALTTVTTKEGLVEAVAWAQKHHKPHLMVGGGSNIIFSDGYHGLIIVNALHGFNISQEDDQGATVQIGAGEDWDQAVQQSVKRGLSGLEKLSAIPGTAGATPVQNVGAYGAEIADTLVSLEAYDTATKQFITLTKEDCKFSYRTSIFKSPHNRHYIIISITLHLAKVNPQPPFYATLQDYLDKNNITTFTPQTIRDATIAIRAQKLPNPKIIPNTGSFFKNPIVEHGILAHIQQTHPDVPFYNMPNNKIKLLAGWLIDQAGLKGYASHGMKVYEKNALVFVNESAQTYADLAAFKQEIISKVEAAFCVRLEQEPELV